MNKTKNLLFDKCEICGKELEPKDVYSTMIYISFRRVTSKGETVEQSDKFYMQHVCKQCAKSLRFIYDEAKLFLNKHIGG